MATYKNFDELLAYLQKAVNDTLENEVADTVKQCMEQAIDVEVYSVYTPIKYDRRGDAGGLGDTGNINAALIEDGLLQVTNDTPLNNTYGINQSGKTLTEIVVTGEGYMYAFDPNAAYLDPRDFIGLTKRMLDEGKLAEVAVNKGLKRYGFGGFPTIGISVR